MSPIEILAAIQRGSLLGPATFDGVDCDAVLAAIDASPEYEAEWMRLQDLVDGAWERAAPSETVRDLAKRIHKHVFFAVKQASHEHDIAAWVADDLDLIVRGRIAGVTDSFLERLWATYENDSLPSPALLAVQ